MSIFVLNIATMLGLALAIDYSLFIVSRFREELRRGRTVGEAVERAGGHRRQGRRVQRHRRRHRAVRPAPLRGAGHPLDRHRRRRSSSLCSVFFALTFLPAVLGMLGHRVNALSIGGLRHRFRPVAGRRRGRADVAAGSASRMGHAPPDRGPRPDPRLPAASSASRSCASSRACPAPRSTRPASRAATPTSPSRPSSRPARRRRSSSSPTSTGSPTDVANITAITDYAAGRRRHRRHRPGRGPVRHPRPGDRARS